MDKISSDDNSKSTANLPLQNSGESTHPIIKRLPKEIVNRIAAGEISVKDGGLKLIQVQDNGFGIHHLDLPLLCERFTTSKLKDFSDLSKISTFGFRGEALASLSHVALVTVITRTANQNCAFKVKYRAGVAESKPLPCAGNPGTTIVAENLFYNAPIRKSALKNGREELSRIVDVVSQYAIHYAQQCGFHLHSESITGKSSIEQDLRTSAGWSRMDAIRAVIGSSVEQNLISFNSSQCTSSESTRLAIERFGLRYEGLLTAPNQVSSGCSPSLKFSLFINNRLVSCTPIKRIVECAYSSVTSRALLCNSTDQHQITNKKTFKMSTSSNIMFKSSTCNSLYVYLNIQLPAHTLDVNVHPTKAEVNFLHEDEIVNGLQDAVEHALLSSVQIRTFIRNALPTPTSFKNLNESNINNAHSSDDNNSKDLRSLQPVYKPHEKVRIDIREQQLERFLSSQPNHVSNSVNNSKIHSKLKVSQDKPLTKSLGELSPDIEVDSDEADEILNSNLLQKNTSFNLYESDRSTNDATEKLHLYYQSQKDSDENKPNVIGQKRLHSHSNNDDNVSLTSKPIIKPDTVLSSLQNSPPHSTSTNNNTDLLSKSNTLLTSSNSDITESTSKPRHRTVHLMSILALKRNLECDLDQSIKATLRSCKFIGFIDSTRCLAQYNTELLLIRLKPLSQALFYQLLLANFGNHGEIILHEPAPLSDLLSIGHEYLRKSSRLLASLTSSEFIRDATATLVEHAPMLWDYFSIKITTDSCGNHVLAGIPLIIANYIPELNQLPVYVTKLATQVSWAVESVCFENICCITANFYAVSSSLFADCTSTSSESLSTSVIENELDKENTTPTSSTSREWMIQYQLWPTLCSSLLPSRRYPNFDSDNNNHGNDKKSFSLQSCFIRLTSLTELYKVFERC
ncbi:DNA mismatch repair protein Mlh1 [Schistosoma japonicum]|nr:DNA mismatch repair protein Mlh1 [Schistosoma japonicum]